MSGEINTSKRIIDSIVDKWHLLNFLLVFVLSVITFIFIFPYREDKLLMYVIGIIFISLMISLLLGVCVCGCINAWANDYKGKTRNIIKLLFSSLLIVFVISSLFLSKNIFVSGKIQFLDDIICGKTTTVYTTDTGECYHKESCGYLKSKHQTTRYEAEINGYSPCSSCYDGKKLKWHSIEKDGIIHMYGLSFAISFVVCAIIYVIIVIPMIKRYNKQLFNYH